MKVARWCAGSRAAQAKGRFLAWAGALSLVAACASPEQRPDRPAPNDDEEAPWQPPDDPTDDYPLDDTGFPPLVNLPPDDVLYIAHDGTFTVSGDPVSGLDGALRVREQLNAPLPPLEPEDEEEDEEEEPEPPDPVDPEEEEEEEEEEAGCDVSYLLTGAPPDQPTGCGPCDFVLNVTFTVTEGDPSRCRGPDTPRDGETWRFGYSAAEGRMFLNYHGTGIYLPWYAGAPDDETDAVHLSWATEVGLVVEDP